jgi:hypothetical protein
MFGGRDGIKGIDAELCEWRAKRLDAADPQARARAASRIDQLLDQRFALSRQSVARPQVGRTHAVHS